jgi:hypothetical protein
MQQLEALVLDLAEHHGVPLKPTAGSGNKFGNADHRMIHDFNLPVRLGVECKDSPTGVRKNHTVPWAEWEKAKLQIERTGATPVFVTGVQGKGQMAHLKLEDFMWLMGILYEKAIDLAKACDEGYGAGAMS